MFLLFNQFQSIGFILEGEGREGTPLLGERGERGRVRWIACMSGKRGGKSFRFICIASICFFLGGGGQL